MKEQKTILDILRQGPTVSLELFPPKEGSRLTEAHEVVQRTAALHPSFISVTYGAAGENAEYSIDMANAVMENGVTALAHLTCVSATREKIAGVLGALRQKGVKNVLALRGDIPADMEFPGPRHYRYAAELVQEVRRDPSFCIGAACYPERHPESLDRAADLVYLKHKVDCGVDFLTTQMFFDNNILYNFLYRALQAGIRVPIIAGVMPVVSAKQIKRICALSGTALPPHFLNIVDRFAADPEAMRQAGIAYCTEQIIDLLANGVEHVHIYTMNRPEIAGAILANLSGIFKAPQE